MTFLKEIKVKTAEQVALNYFRIQRSLFLPHATNCLAHFHLFKSECACDAHAVKHLILPESVCKIPTSDDTILQVFHRLLVQNNSINCFTMKVDRGFNNLC